MTKTFPEVISGIRTAKKGVEVREDIAQMGEYVEQFASTAATKASEAEKSAERAKNAVEGIDQQKADAVKAVQQAQATATNAVTETKNAALQEVSDATADANNAANSAARSASAAAGSASTASGAATTATTKAGEAATSATQADASQKKAAENQQAAEDAANRAAAIVNTDKTFTVEGAPADAKAVGDAIFDRTKETPQPIFYSKAEVEAKIKEILAKQQSEDYAKIKFWVSPDPTSPAELFGGTWKRIKDCFILAAGDTYAAGSTGGEAAHTLTEKELPKIQGTFGLQSNGNSQGMINEATGVFSKKEISTNAFLPNSFQNEGGSARSVNMLFGENLSHNNMPPYIAVYAWKRIA